MERLKNDPKFYIESLLWIKTKKRGLIPLKFNEAQLRIYEEIQKLRKAGKPVRIIILKARQLGVSTESEALIFHDTATNSYVNSLVIAHDRESASHLFRMSQLFYERMNREIRPMKRRSSKIELLFENPNEKTRDNDPGLCSHIRIETAANLSAGRSLTIQNLHISELALWEKAEETMGGLMQSVPDIPESMVIVESTAQGISNYFYNMWNEAVAGENDYVPIFLPWFEMKEYRAKPPLDFEFYDYDHEVFGNELKIKELYKLDFEQLYWRRLTIKNKCKNDLNFFKQEYPSSAEEAFLVTGRPVFNREKITEYMLNCKVPSRGELVEKKPDLEKPETLKTTVWEFKASSLGKLRIWKQPEKGNRYSIGADPAEGLATGDPQCAEVYDKKNYEQVAKWHGKVSPDVFAYVLRDLAKYYNDGLIVPESNNPTTISYLREIYYRIYYRKEINKRTNKTTRELGFRTTSRTKPILIGEFNKLFEDDELIINDKETLTEMSHFVEEDTTKDYKKMKAEGKYHDDSVIATALSLQGLKEVYLNIESEQKSREYKYSDPFTRY
jgi:hypothetical protein